MSMLYSMFKPQNNNVGDQSSLVISTELHLILIGSPPPILFLSPTHVHAHTLTETNMHACRYNASKCVFLASNFLLYFLYRLTRISFLGKSLYYVRKYVDFHLEKGI